MTSALPTRPRRPAALRNPTLGLGLALERAQDPSVAALDGLAGRLRRASEPVRDAARGAADATAAVAETAQRAAHAPADVAREVRRELDAWARGLARTMALGALLALLGLFALALLTAAAVDGLDALLGEPWGAFLVGLGYAAGAGVAGVRMARARREARAEKETHAEHRREDVAQVVEPLREALDVPAPPARMGGGPAA